MDLRYRRAIYSVFIFIFFIISPLIIFYTLGYRYNFEKNRIERTGVFFIKSYPKNATIYLNNKIQKRKTPTQINRLLSNNYNISVQKEGYFSWEKTLPIYPQTTTFIEDITLFKTNSEPKLLLAGDFSQLSVSPNLNRLALIKSNDNGYNLIYYNLLNDDSVSVFSSKNNLQISSWCLSNNKLIVKDKNDFLIVNIETKNTESVFNLTRNYFDKIKCDYYNDNIFYGLSDGSLQQIDLIQKKLKKITPDEVISFLPWKSKVLYISDDQDKFILKSSSNNQILKLLVMPTSANYMFLPSADNYIAILDSDEKIAYIIDPQSDQPYNGIINHIYDIKWYDKQFIHWNDFELWVYYPESKKNIFIERASSEIQNSFWHTAFTYIFGQIDNQLKIFELDTRDKRNVYDLLTLSDQTKDNIFVNKKGDALYLTDKINNQEGFYKIEIQ